MYKIFAKTQFLGKNVVFLPQCHSTNEEARALNMSGRLHEGTVVWTDYQEKGRGQQGNIWLSERGKNLLCTIYLSPIFLEPNRQYLLNLVSSLAIHKTLLQHLPLKKIEIKWPNDIYVNDRKIAGILTETTIGGSKLEQVYCGIGLNVNQSHFSLPNASSMFIESGMETDRESLLEQILQNFEGYYSLLQNDPITLIDNYMSHMRWRGEVHSFRSIEGEFEGIIEGIDNNGKILIRNGNNLMSFDVKQIEFVH